MFISTLVIVDRPLWPPVSGLEKFPYIVAGSLLLGATLSLSSVRIQASALFAMAATVLMLLWLGWSQLQRAETLWLIGGLGLTGCVLLVRINHIAASLPDKGIMIGMAALGLAGIAVVSGSALVGELAVALASATAGFMFWWISRTGRSLGPLITFAAVIPLLAITALCLLLSDASPIALGLLGLVFFVDRIRAGSSSVSSRSLSSTVFLALRAGAVAGMAIGVALLTDNGGDLYYH